ncbi:MFS transporter [Actinocatenispora rupis]|uniref:Minor myo-inositol transporter IolF n=1 Tax=Actinocatenispora rupis TaxID=519421 RepID=A0A8J3J5K6_9ACTN|nr:MFS transporter [Actinocatenispora rupis]GID12031.1 minor myo-inositol transporter IolF [Actinocatenispora rupis]
MTDPHVAAPEEADDRATRRRHWKWTAVAGMASYIDAGSIVAGSVGLALWSKKFGLTDSTVGLLGAFSSNAISAGVGALIGGWICDRFGRKKIYTWDLLLYAFGILWLICSVNSWMLFVGYILCGLAVGADVPASWTLITELAPAKNRGRMGGLAQVLWNLGPVVTLLLSLALAPLGMLGVRLVFVHLLVVALVTWILRKGVSESSRWKEATATEARRTGQVAGTTAARIAALFTRRGATALLFCIGMYGVWNLFAGTNGFYFPYLLSTFGAQSQAASVGLQCVSFLLTVVGTLIVYMPLNDRVNRRVLLGISVVLQFLGMGLFVVLPLNLPVALAYVILIGFGSGFGQQHFFQLWSGELFPTILRSTAQGFTFAVVRIGLGIWSFFVPLITHHAGFRYLALILVLLQAVSGVIGVVFGPRTAGKTLEEIEVSRGWRSAGQSGPVTAEQVAEGGRA